MRIGWISHWRIELSVYQFQDLMTNYLMTMLICSSNKSEMQTQLEGVGGAAELT